MAVNFISNLFSIFAFVLLPVFAGLVVISPFFPNNAVKIRRFAKGFCIFNLIYSLLFILFTGSEISHPEGVFGFINTFPFEIIPGVELSFAMDNFSALMCVLTCFIMLLALICAKSMITSKQKLFYSLMLLLQGTILGIFTANNPLTFFLFWELELIPVFFLISMWGGTNAKKSAQKFVLFTFAGSVFMLIATALIYAYGADAGVPLDFGTLFGKAGEFPLLLQFIASLGFLIAFAVKLPVFGFHTWLADAHTEAPTPVSMVLAGILLKTGAYGLIRINLQMFQEVFQLIAPLLIFLGALSVLWASYAAIAQSDIKRMIAFSSIAHMGVILIGITSFSDFGLKGAVFHTAAHALISAGLFAGAGIIYLKFKTRKLELLGAISKYTPILTVLMLFLGLGAIGMPLTMGFPGEIMSLAGGFLSPLVDTEYFMSGLIQPAVLLASGGIILSAVYILRLFHKTFFGVSGEISQNNFEHKKVQLSNHQIAVLSILVLGIMIFGLYPMGIIDMIAF